MYQRYKLKTQSFRDKIKKLLPESTKLTSVSDLSRASGAIFYQFLKKFHTNGNHRPQDYHQDIDDSNQEYSKSAFIEIPHEIIKDLNESIRLRT